MVVLSPEKERQINSTESAPETYTGEKIEVEGVGFRKDLYNITAPFTIDGETFILGREESKKHSRNSHVVWVRQVGEKWIIDRNIPSIKGEDPSITTLVNEKGDKETVVGIVHVTWKNKKATNWQMSFYKGKGLAELQDNIDSKNNFSSGPENMKDIRLVNLSNGRVGIFTRPQGGEHGLGQIGYIEVDSIKDVNEENILSAEILDGMFHYDEWGGVNEVHVLSDKHLGVLGHVAYKTEDETGETKHYMAMTFIFNRITGEASDKKIIASSDDFPSGRAKNSELEDVIFSGGLRFEKDGTATLYAGLRDKEPAKLKIKDPFINYK